MRKTLVAVAIGTALSLAACSDAEQQNQQTSQQAETAQAEQASKDVAQQNPFFEPSPLQYQAPDFDAIKFEHFEPAFERGMKEHMEEIEAITPILISKNENPNQSYKNNENWTKRKCLCCGKIFDSWGIGNRLCQRCK